MTFLLTILLLTSTVEQQLEDYVTEWMSTIRFCYSYDQRLEDAKSYIPIVVKYSEQYDVDPFLIAIVISEESSWRMRAVGKSNDTGLMQVIPRYFEQFDLTTADGQIHAGVSHLRKSLDQCGGNVEQALTYYKCNRCTPVHRKMRGRARRYRSDLWRFRK